MLLSLAKSKIRPHFPFPSRQNKGKNTGSWSCHSAMFVWRSLQLPDGFNAITDVSNVALNEHNKFDAFGYGPWNEVVFGKNKAPTHCKSYFRRELKNHVVVGSPLKGVTVQHTWRKRRLGIDPLAQSCGCNNKRASQPKSKRGLVLRYTSFIHHVYWYLSAILETMLYIGTSWLNNYGTECRPQTPDMGRSWSFMSDQWTPCIHCILFLNQLLQLSSLGPTTHCHVCVTWVVSSIVSLISLNVSLNEQNFYGFATEQWNHVDFCKKKTGNIATLFERLHGIWFQLIRIC